MRQIVREWRRRNKKVVLACPTARAASVLSESVGQSASTIHRLLEYNPQEERYKRDQNNQLDADALVIDEASMLDLKLAARLLEATPETCSLLFVGDKDQLPSVGAGAVLHDLLRSPRVPRVELATVFRQVRGAFPPAVRLPACCAARLPASHAPPSSGRTPRGRSR